MTTPRQHRRYPKATKAALILLADQTSINAAAEAGAVPPRTLGYWMDQPEYAELRLHARERMAEEALTVARKGWGLLAEKLPELEPRDLIDLVEMATSKALLMSGEATARTEHRDLEDADAIAVAAISELVGAAIASGGALIGVSVVAGGDGAGADGLH